MYSNRIQMDEGEIYIETLKLASITTSYIYYISISKIIECIYKGISKATIQFESYKC